jgi:hypothetical protein
MGFNSAFKGLKTTVFWDMKSCNLVDMSIFQKNLTPFRFQVAAFVPFSQTKQAVDSSAVSVHIYKNACCHPKQIFE